MGFELPNGKTARNLQDQVKFLTEKIKELIARVNELELHIEIVDELPETGSSDIIYFVPVEDPEEGNYYNEYMWIDDAWELIGTTQIDLSGYVDLTSAQTITGQKIFRNFTVSADALYDSGLWNFKGWGGSGIDIDFTNTGKGIKISPTTLEPTWGSSGNMDLGTSSSKFKDLYLSGSVNFDTNIRIFKDQYGGIMFQNNANNYPLQVYSNAVYVSQDLLTAASKDLGSSSHAWKDLYLSGSIHGTSTYLAIDSPDFTTITIGGSEIQVNADFNCNGNKSLGDASKNKYWKDLYLSRNLSDGTNTVSVAQLASGIGGTYRHVIYIEGATADINIAVNLNSATPITTQAALAAINNNVMGGTATLDVQGSYKIVAIDSVGTVGSIVYLDDTGQHTLNIVDIYQDVVNQI